jgi:RNA polymerase sigma-70 factor (ECF subfamily)
MANRAFFRSSSIELTVAMALQAVSRTGSKPAWGEAQTAESGPEPDPTQARAHLLAAPDRDPEPRATDEVHQGRSTELAPTYAAEINAKCMRRGSAVQRERPVKVARELRDASERELLCSLLEGDNGAWQQFDRRYSGLIQSCIRRTTAQFPAIGPDDTREIEAMLWVQLLANDRRKLRGFQPERGCALSTWVGMLAIHCAYDYLRALRREPVRVALADAERLSSELPDPADLCAAREHAARLEAALECFSARDREFVRLYFGEGLEAEQVAGQMGISVKTVYSKKHKIRLRLESAMGQGRLAA